jgi:hypothetical protein
MEIGEGGKFVLALELPGVEGFSAGDMANVGIHIGGGLVCNGGEVVHHFGILVLIHNGGTGGVKVVRVLDDGDFGIIQAGVMGLGALRRAKMVGIVVLDGGAKGDAYVVGMAGYEQAGVGTAFFVHQLWIKGGWVVVEKFF